MSVGVAHELEGPLRSYAHPSLPKVFYYTKMEVENFNNDIILAEACRSDVDKYCANVEPGAWQWAHLPGFQVKAIRLQSYTPQASRILANI